LTTTCNTHNIKYYRSHTQKIGHKSIVKLEIYLSWCDIIGYIHDPVVILSETFHFSHHWWLDRCVSHLICFFIQKHPAEGGGDREMGKQEIQSNLCFL